MSEFIRWFAAAAAKRLGQPLPKDFQHGQIAQLQNQLGLNGVISRPVFARLARREKAPSPRVQREIRIILEPQPISESAAVPKANGFRTRDLIRLSFDPGDIPEYLQPRDEPDVVLEQGFDERRTLLRCLDDPHHVPPGEEVAPDADLMHFVRQARPLALHYASVTLLTHRVPSATLRGELAKDNVRLVTVQDFMSRRFLVSHAKEEIKNELERRTLDSSSKVGKIGYRVDSIPGRGDALGYLIDLVTSDRSKGRPTVFLGHAGAGKTSLLLLAAQELIDRAEKSPSRLPLPVLVEPSHLNRMNGVWQAIGESIRLNYKRLLPENLIRRLVESGHLIVLIDGLDETRAAQNRYGIGDIMDEFPPGVGEQSRVVVCTRPELFRSSDEQADVLAGATTVYLQPLDPQEARRILELRVRPDTARILLDARGDRELAARIQEVITTPLFLDMLCRFAESARDEIFSLDEGSEYSSALAYRLFQYYVTVWIDRERSKERPFQLRLTDDRRKEFCQWIAAEFFIGQATDQKITTTLLERIAEDRFLQDRSPRSSEDRESLVHDFLRDANLSMLLIRREDPETGQKDRRFIHSAFYEYFLAVALTDEILDVSLHDGPFYYLAAGRLKRNLSLLPRFMLGRLQTDQRSGGSMQRPRSSFAAPVLTRRLDDLRYDPKIRAVARRSDSLVFNLLSLIAGVCRVTSTPIRLSLDGLALPHQDLCMLSQDKADASASPVLTLEAGNANLEFVRAPEADVRLVPSTHALFLTVASEEEIPRHDVHWSHQYTKLQTFQRDWVEESAEAAHLRERLAAVSAPGFDWLLVAGGRWHVGKYREEATGDAANFRRISGSIRVGSFPVILPTFLIQRSPVTNRQFYEFLMADPIAHRDWFPQHQRLKTDNTYYLLAWDQMLNRVVTPDWLPEKELKKDRSLREWWERSPVVQVNWHAARAFAEYYGWSLPTEAEFEAAARLYQGEDLLNQRADAPRHGLDRSDYPWGETLDADATLLSAVEGYAITSATVRARGEGTREALEIPAFPTWDGTIEDPEGWLSRFKDWARGRDVPYHLVGGVLEWMNDAWSPDWPPETNAVGGYDDRPRGAARGTAKSREDRVLRGGSMATLPEQCRISHRAPQPATNVNPDAGFRCVQRLWPKPYPKGSRGA